MNNVSVWDEKSWIGYGEGISNEVTIGGGTKSEGYMG